MSRITILAPEPLRQRLLSMNVRRNHTLNYLKSWKQLLTSASDSSTNVFIVDPGFLYEHHDNKTDVALDVQNYRELALLTLQQSFMRHKVCISPPASVTVTLSQISVRKSQHPKTWPVSKA